MPEEPAAFMSYVRLDDQHDNGQLTQFRERLSAEVRVQTGEEFPIFQDRNDIAWGQAWQERIEQALDAATLLVAIITPSFFRSPACRKEVERFLERERELSRHDLILPVYYVSTPELDDPALRDADDLAKELASRQFADWRELRFESFTSPAVRKTLAQLATRMRDSFWRQGSQAKTETATRERLTRGPQTKRAEPLVSAKVTAKTEPPTHVVDPYERGDFVTVREAIDAARPGDRILVRPGLYQEGLVIDKPLEILGDGPLADIEIRAHSADAILFKANIGRVANLTLRQAGGDGSWHGVDIVQGRLELEGCDIASDSLASLGIRNGADPRVRRCTVHRGIDVYANGLGTLEDNNITADDGSGVEIRNGSSPTLRRNNIHNCKESGVSIYEAGRGTLEDNDITANLDYGVEIGDQSNAALRHNRINGNGREGIIIEDSGGGVIEDNDLTGNKLGAWNIAAAAEDNVTRARNQE